MAEVTVQNPAEETAALESKMRSTIESVRNGEIPAKEAGMGKMLKEMEALDAEKYRALIEEWKPLSAKAFPKENPTPFRTVLTNEINQQNRIMIEEDYDDGYVSEGLPGDEVYIGGDDGDRPQSKRGPASKKPKSVNRERVAKVRPLHVPKEKKPKGERDRSAYKFNGEEYGKGPLVRAIVGAHVASNPGITHDELKKAFPDTLLRSYGLFKRLAEAQEISKVRKRYFLKDDQLIQVADCQVAVCNQFTSDNFQPFLDQAKKLGYVIE